MDVEIHQKALLAQEHLKSQIDAWNFVKPFFDEMVKDISPLILPFLLKSLMHYKKNIKTAKKELHYMSNLLDKVCIVEQLLVESYGISNMQDLTDIANGVLEALDVLQNRFEGEQNIPFKKLPYEFQTRLIELLPRYDLVTFKMAGKFNLKVKKMLRHETLSHFLVVVDSKGKYEDKKTRFAAEKYYDIISVTNFLKSDNFYVQHRLFVDLESTEDFDDVVKSINGEYVFLELRGSYTWRHAINLMYRSSKLTSVTLYHAIQIEEMDFDEFFDAVAQWLYERRPYVLEIRCSHLDDTFQPRFKDYVERETQFNVYSYFSSVVVCMEPWFR